MRFRCACCGNDQRGMMALVRKLPESIFCIPEADRAARAKVGSDLCVLDEEHFFVRAVLPIPVIGSREDFEFGVWGTLKRENFDIYVEEFDNPSPEFGPFFSWLSSDLPPYVETFNLPSELEFRGNNLRPVVRLHSGDHPLITAQRRGIKIDRVAEIYRAWSHDVSL